MTDYQENAIYVYFLDTLERSSTILLPLLADDDRITGIAYVNGELHVYNSEKNAILRLDLDGNLLDTIPVTLPNDPKNPRDKAIVSSLAYDPTGRPGGGPVYWMLELARGMVYGVDPQGAVVTSFPHPAEVEAPVPPLSGIYNHAGGLALVPGTHLLDLTSGTVFERTVVRVVRVDPATGQALSGVEIPLDDLNRAAPNGYAAIEHAAAGGIDGLYAATSAGSSSMVVELDPTLPDPRPITSFTAGLDGRSDTVVLSFVSNDAYDSVEVSRDCAPLATLGAEETAPGRHQIEDRDVPPGPHRYDIQGFKGGVAGLLRTSRIRVGTGARLGWAWATPVAWPTQIARDPIDRSFLVSSRNVQGRDLFRFQSDFSYAETIPGVVPPDYEVATLAIRPDGGASRSIYVMAWKEPSSLGGDQGFLLCVLDGKGATKRQIEIHPPARRTASSPTPRASPGTPSTAASITWSGTLPRWWSWTTTATPCARSPFPPRPSRATSSTSASPSTPPPATSSAPRAARTTTRSRRRWG